MKFIKKIKHNISIIRHGGETPDSMLRSLIKQSIRTTLIIEEVDTPCAINVLITNDEGILKYNRKFRNIDKSTDVLSFPMQDFTNAGWCGNDVLEFDEDTGQLPLGDIIISTETVLKQANDYVNTVEKETSFLIIHSTLHLLGYDHNNRKNKHIMRVREKIILKEMGYPYDK